MSLKLSVTLPIEHLPAPEAFINNVSKLWLPDTEESNVVELNLMANRVLVICPQLEQHGYTKWLENTSYTFYLSNLSTRGLEVWHYEGQFHVRIMSLSTPEEWELAFQMLEYAVDGENASILTDWEPSSLRLHTIRQIFDETKITEALYAQVSTLFGAVSKIGTHVELEGPVNNFYVGPWLCSRIISAFENIEESMDDVVETLFALMLLANFVGVLPRFAGFQAPAYSRKPLSDGSVHVAAAISPGKGFFVNKVDELVVQDSFGTLIGIPAEQIKELLPRIFREPDQLTWVDEYQFALGPISNEEYTRLVLTASEAKFAELANRHSRGFLRKIADLFRG